MANAIFLFDSYSDDGTVTASSEAASMPAENVQDQRRSKVWRSGAGTSSYLDFTMPSGIGWNYIALVDVNLTAGGTITIEGWSDAHGGSEEVFSFESTPGGYLAGYGYGGYGLGAYGGDPGSVSLPVRNTVLIPLSAVYTDTYWRVTFTDANTSYQQCGRVIFGQSKQPSVNVSYGWSLSREFRSKIRESIGGQRYVQQRDSRLLLSMALDWLDDDERTDFALIFQEFGVSRPFVFSLIPGNQLVTQTVTMYCHFTNPSLTHANFNINRMPLNLREEF